MDRSHSVTNNCFKIQRIWPTVLEKLQNSISIKLVFGYLSQFLVFLRLAIQHLIILGRHIENTYRYLSRYKWALGPFFIISHIVVIRNLSLATAVFFSRKLVFDIRQCDGLFTSSSLFSYLTIVNSSTQNGSKRDFGQQLQAKFDTENICSSHWSDVISS